MHDKKDIAVEAERIQSSGVLGEARVRRLFDYLVTSSMAGTAPKEIAVAIDVFGRNSDFDPSQDALVRVYVHKLRKALEDFYASHDGSKQGVLHVPRGEYRLKFSAQTTAQAPTPRPSPLPPPPRTRRRRAVVFTAAAVLAGMLSIGSGMLWLRTPHSELEKVRATPLWSAILNDDRPIKIIVGDYYLIGETDASMEVKRLIREYAVNSKSDLENYVSQHPELADRYTDVGLRYLPIACAFALRDVMAVLAPANQRIGVIKMSDVQPSDLKTVDLVYIGYLSGLGMMQDIVLTDSRFAIGESFDEVVDTKIHHSYISQTREKLPNPPQPFTTEKTYHDYGLFESFLGPGGNTVIVISGTRDAGVQQTADTFTNAEKLEEFARQANVARPLEALLEVSTFDGMNLSGKVLTAAERKSNVSCTTCKVINNSS